MRLLDADILSHGLYDESPAHPYAWKLLRRGLKGELELHVTPTTILETYNVLFWFYRVRPRSRLLEKLRIISEGLRIVGTSIRGIDIARVENIPLGDGFLIATALDNRIPIIVSNDRHLTEKAPKYGLIVENPIPEDVRRRLSKPDHKA